VNNPLLEERGDIPFDRIRPEHVVPAIEAAIERAAAGVEQVAAIAEPRTYDEVLGALDRATHLLERSFAVVEHLEGVATSPALRDAYGAAQEKSSAFWSGLPLHEGLFAVLSRYAETEDARSLEGIRRRHLDKLMEDFVRSGAKLGAEGKARLRAIDVELAQKTTKFAQNTLDSTNAYELVVEDEARLEGLPETAKKAARAAAAAKDRAGWRFTLHAPSYVPAVTHLGDRALREQLWRAYNERASSGDLDNRALLKDILRLRREKAELLGMKDFSDFATADRMAKSGARARAFVHDLRDKTRAFFEREKEELRAYGRELGLATLEAWDVGWVAEKMRKARHDFDEEALRPYFSANSSVAGIFAILSRLYGVSFVRDESAPTWHPSAEAYRLVDDARGRRLATIYVDLFPRESKNGGAWMMPMRTGSGPDDPHVALVSANFTPPDDKGVALLTHREVETLFHEFGHLVHACLSDVPVRRLAGTNVAWDFVELPSQLMENWAWEREVLDLFAKHHETGETLPEALFERMVAARNFRVGSVQMQQLGYAELDLALHCDVDPHGADDPMAVARDVLAEHVTAALPPSYAMVASFGHLFASPVGYAAGYYSYKWAEVLGADAFGRFLEEGLLEPKVGAAFRASVLERGDSEDATELFRRFRGRDPELGALLRKQGLVAEGAAPPAGA
jgi:oligopeptidase A